MSIYGAMRTSVSGMAAQADRISTISDNVANTSTVGYKRAEVEFASLVVAQGASAYESGAVEVEAGRAITQQGLLRATGGATDLAIDGSGFLVVRAPDGETRLTRAGSFREDASGTLINMGGMALLGYDLSAGSGAPVNGQAGLVPIVTRGSALVAVPSRNAALGVNFPSASGIATVPPSANSPASTHAGKTSLVAYGRLGEQIMLDVYFARTAPGVWEVTVFDAAGAAPGGGPPFAGGPLATASLSFDPTNGRLVDPLTARLAVTPALGETMTLDLAGSTQLAADFAVQSVAVDGRAPVPQTRVEVSEKGIVSAVYQNGDRVPIFRIPLAAVPGADRLRALGAETFAVTEGSGAMVLGSAGDGGRGTVQAGMLEQSNVDLAVELTEMIDAQRSYSANSRVFQAGAELMDVIVNLKR